MREEGETIAGRIEWGAGRREVREVLGWGMLAKLLLADGNGVFCTVGSPKWYLSAIDWGHAASCSSVVRYSHVSRPSSVLRRQRV